ncbi:transglycosylase domain-containing protein [Sphingomonas pseudosanguinis]|uniref:Penicillin-binding protein 1A n=1 Tax=Sphingomonas pseudosanguinis TaxID=413712 RepID=A0A7W6ACB4_9SPHN|nr:transglycosylase domain-containing protein [Sphingomonas pseudosanguinis]MBB3880702.1 penicillin-binding protein 1A [Sphingomonas pseudosanguinis]MBN3535174.1 penicillin-binding protein [Sphingomonas pseudosanguinis]
MRPDPFNPDRMPIDRPYEPVGHHYPLYDAETQSWSFGPDEEEPTPGRPRRQIRWGRWITRGLGVGIILLVIAVIWLAITAPLSRSLQPPTPPSITLTADDGTPIARRGAIIGAPVDAAKLPPHVREAFFAIEDRRFYSHWGIDPRGILRAAWHNLGSGGVREGGSTITQQLAKNAFLDSDRTAGRKIREAMIALWLEAWLTKDEILSRYLSNVYFGDNVYGLTAASKHYFGRTPDKLNIGQAAMLAGLVKAPSRLAPTSNLKGARARQAVVIGAMEDAGFLTKAEADAVQPQRVLAARPETLPSGTYFADWVLPEARDQAGEIKTEATVQTTLNPRLQRIAERTVRSAGLREAQVALVAMRPDGRVVAMVGGKDYSKSPFNRATQARRQPGSAFKLFVYLAALRSGMTPDSTIEDEPVDIAGWKPRNSDGRYLGKITLRQAFARSSNVAAARLTQAVGVKAVTKAARDLGISTPIANEATIGLGTSTVSLLELTAAYAAVANESYPVAPHGLTDVREKGWYQSLTDRKTGFSSAVHDGMLDLLSASIKSGTGRQAMLTVDAYGKTGTTQDSRDALFVGFARDLVVGVWVGNDDNTPNPGLSGGGVPARIWRAFMQSALDIPPVAAPVVQEEVDPDAYANGVDEEVMPAPADPVGEIIQGLGLDLRTGDDGSITVGPGRRRPERAGPGPDDRRPPDERYEGEGE